MTCRGLFYRLVSNGVIAKTEGEYKSTVIRLTGKMRRSGELPFGWVTDSTRMMRKPMSYGGLEDLFERQARVYRRNIWNSQDTYVEIWCEKDALLGTIYPVTSKWDVPLMPTRGYPSLSFLHAAAESIRCEGKPAFLYYLGDWDPSGLDIPRTVEKGIREFAPDVDLTFERLAVTEWQIEGYRLQTRPTKETDSRRKNFAGESVEVDAIPPQILRQLVEDSITEHVDKGQYEALKRVEQAERQTLARMGDGMWGET
jgi:hypothetical protein